MKKLCVDGQSVIEYAVILAIVAAVSLIFAAKYILPDESGTTPRLGKLFIGYVQETGARAR